MSEKKPTKQEQAIELLKANYGSDLFQVVESTPKGFKAVLGYSKRNHNRLVEYTHRTKYAKILKSSSEISFKEMVEQNTVVEEVEQTEKE